MTRTVVAILGTRYADFAIERDVLDPLGVELRAAPARTKDELLEAAADATVVLAGSGPRFDADVIARLRVKGIVRCGVGTETIDLEAARRANIWVARVADYGTQSVALHTTALILAALRRLVPADNLVKKGEWQFASLRPLHLPSALTAGLLGFGRIGREVARQLTALGFDVLASDPGPVAPDPAVRLCAMDELLPRAHVLSLHLAARADGRPVIGADELARLPAGAIVVNTSRGSVLDMQALIAALRSGHLAHAALDVFDREPPDLSVFADVLDRVTFSPHMAWYTVESEHDLRRKSALAAAAILRGERPADAVVIPN